MHQLLSFILAHPEYVGTALVLAESVIMPFIPTKWNGLTVTAFGLLKKKLKVK